jgi:hypothetical protein
MAMAMPKLKAVNAQVLVVLTKTFVQYLLLIHKGYGPPNHQLQRHMSFIS